MSFLRAKGIVVFSGGSAANNLVDVFRSVSDTRRCALSYVIPISDNGGSSSELIRVFGGPGRLLRLIPNDDDDDHETAAMKAFFNHRLPADSSQARLEWLEIVESRHSSWTDISSQKKELIRSFLNLVNLEVVKRARPSSVFNFSSASIGNLFLTGARLFSGSLESAIYLLSAICHIPSHVAVLPAINTNFTHHISCLLTNGATITGQNSISHPSEPTALSADARWSRESEEVEAHDSIEDANLPGSLPTLRKGYINFSKAAEEDLPARIERLWYINPYGQEIRPPVNLKVREALESASAVVYSIGSLYTSIVPNLILRGVGEAIARTPSIRHKVLILNSTIDRETGPSSEPFTATDFVAAIARAGQESRGMFGVPDPSVYRSYVTNIVYLEGPETPYVNKVELSQLGIETLKCYGRKLNEGGKVLRYDEKALEQALEAIIGRKDGRTDRSRRNTMEG
ncbi:UPF0052-domain-containing protein [Rhizodiscina lignyota]|uniref:UPF0052-domain-containing protein n=1 Tax=Rhizodiscina lignyota TaxID=1504668 RepID=A0A9P4IQM1_9PEZI|nr:UPF0052-domain-containing protein [Rhizodiscina lignyota]